MIFKRTDDHIFEKTMKIELSPIPQAYTLNQVVKFLHNNSHQIILTVIKDRDLQLKNITYILIKGGTDSQSVTSGL